MKRVKRFLSKVLADNGFELEQPRTKDAIDLVCGMEVSSKNAKFQTEYQGETYYFCSEGCKTHFDNDPEKYAGS